MSTPNPAPKILVQAERSVAYESPDHILPWGTRRDNSRNRRFNQKIYSLYDYRKETLKILDMGCSGGGFVKDCLDDGCLSVGIEGSDYSKRFRRAEWATIPDFLFTCDITGNFDVLLDVGQKPERIKFDVVTSWEVIEHIAEKDLAKVAENVKKHLAPHGIWIMSVSPNEEVLEGVVLHQTVQPMDWWVRKFASLGLVHRPEFVEYLNTQFIRGPKFNAPGSFHLVLALPDAKLPPIPNERFLARVFDRWYGSSAQKILNLLVNGVK